MHRIPQLYSHALSQKKTAKTEKVFILSCIKCNWYEW